MLVKNNKKIINAWAMYDWANSAHNLVIVSGIFPIYYTATAINSDGGDIISFLGIEAKNTVFFSFAISFAYLTIALINPVLTAIADYTGRKKPFMKFFCYLGALSCMSLYFFTKGNNSIGIISFCLSVMGWTGSVVFYNSFLPEIATEEHFDKISAKGFALGYIGSVILMVFNLTMIMMPQWYGGIESGYASRISFFLVGIWWIGFAQIAFKYLPDNTFQKKPNGNYLLNGFKELKSVFLELKHLTHLKRFLLSFFFYNMGVQTVMFVAALFGGKELKLPAKNLIITILLIQLVAIGGSYLFAFISKKLGNTRALQIAIFIWIGICIGAYYVTNGNEFYLLAVVVGSVMGGIQSLSRSTYAKLIPDNTTDNASFFSFFDFTEKVSLVLGTAMYGVVEQITGSMRNSVLGLLVFFVIGFILLLRVPSQNIYKNKLKI